jgi:hypothetical protein
MRSALLALLCLTLGGRAAASACSGRDAFGFLLLTRTLAIYTLSTQVLGPDMRLYENFESAALAMVPPPHSVTLISLSSTLIAFASSIWHGAVS